MKSNNKVFAALGATGLVMALFAILATAWLISGGPASAGTKDTGKGDAPAPTATAAATQQPKTTTITVRGSGSVSARPDTIRMNVGVAIMDTTVKGAQAQVSKATDAMIAKLSAAKVTESDYRTSQYSVEPVMDYGTDKGGGQQTPRLTGFRVTNILEITLRDASKAPDLLDQLVSAGANTVYNVNYTFADSDALSKQAYDSAVKDAQVKAERLAGLSSLTLGRIVNVTDSSANIPGPVYPVMDGGKGGGGGAVYPGQQSIQSDVIVTYEATIK